MSDILSNIQIASPCTTDWKYMFGDDRVRHCASCRLNVYNLSSMTRMEIEKLVREREGRLCVRFFRRTDGTVMTQDCPVGITARIRTRYRRLVWGIGIFLAGYLGIKSFYRNYGATMGKPGIVMGDIVGP